MILEVVILTKSTMMNDYCIAGLDVKTGGWIRLVNDDAGNPLMTSLHGGYEPLDVVSVDVERVPLRNQT